MHAVHGAMSISREQEKREKRRQSRIERSNSKSPRNSDVSNLEKGEAGQRDLPDPPQPESSLTAFHLGIVFILLGFVMVLVALIKTSMLEGDWSHTSGVGYTFVIVGLILVMVNGIITANEEEELAKHVTTRLASTRSDYQIGRDIGLVGMASLVGQVALPGGLVAEGPLPVLGSVGQKDAGSSASDTIPKIEVMVTETETLLTKKDNKPALIVTKETSMKKTSSTRHSRQISLSST